MSKRRGPANDDLANTLGGTNVFEGIDTSTLGHIAALAQIKECVGGEVLYGPGDEADDVYVLLSGRVNFALMRGETSHPTGSIISSRQVFGWAALVPDHPKRVATARCLDSSSILTINGEKLLQLLEAEPAAGFKVMQRLAAMIARNFMDQNE